MIHNLELTLEQRPEVLERVLRVTRHTGFTVRDMHMTLAEDQRLQLAMAVDSDRAIELLSRQLTKLVDVARCTVRPASCLSRTVNG